MVMTNYPKRQILSKLDLSGRLIKWVIELGIYDLRYELRIAKKGQVVANFLVKIQSFESVKKQQILLAEEAMKWALNTDGSTNKCKVRIGVVLESAIGIIIEESLCIEQKMTNNEAGSP